MSNAKSGCYKNENYTKQEYECQFCKKKWYTYKHAFTQHLNKCRFNPNNPDCVKEFIVYCEKCGSEYTVKCTDNDYNKGNYRRCCSSKCSHTRILSKESRIKISESLYNTLGIKSHSQINCSKCGKPISHRNKSCWCEECIHTNYKEFREQFPLSDDVKLKLSVAGRKGVAAQAEVRRSKNEIAFCTLCEQHCSNVEHNVPIFNGWDADVIIHDIKYAVLWNGKWHYEKITADHSVEQVQNRDRIKMNEIIIYGYTPYIIKDVGKHKKSFVKEEFDKFIKLVSEL